MNPIIDGQQPSWRLWGEEEHDGAIYTVYLKKVRYHPGTTVSSDSDDKVSHLEWETVRIRMVKAGYLDKLVESLANDSGEMESTYVNIFLSTYRSFATPQQVLHLLLNRYKQLDNRSLDMKDSVKELHRRTLMQSLLVWLDMYPEDFYDPPQYLSLHQIVDFARKHLPGCALEIRARHRIERFKRDGEFKVPEPFHGWCAKYGEDNSSSPTLLPYKFLEVSEDHFAQQLTWMDAELFKKLVPHHCLGSIWSRRDRAKGWNVTPTTVTATVNQFNAVSLRVIATVLSDPSLKPTARARIITKWIDIAQELRVLKNFSSLKATTAALQSNPVYRLRRVWLAVSREKIEVFNELARIFSEDNNQMNCRELLIKEGSAKFADTVGENDRQLQKLFQKQLSNRISSTMQGTVPYLGTFLTDLTMIDTAIPDSLPNSMINFDKRRKEFEILAQIKLLQSAANNYNLAPDNRFQAWFESIPVLDDNESHELSCLIEAPDSTVMEKRPAPQKTKSLSNMAGHKKSNSTSSTSTSSSNSQWFDQSSSDISMASIQPESAGGTNGIKASTSYSNLSLCASQSPGAQTTDSCQTPEFYIIRVSLEQDSRSEEDGVNLYKSIMLSNRDRTHTVICNAMLKHCIVGDPEDYTLVQLVPGGEIVFPDSANVYYAINTSYDLNFILRKRKDSDPPPGNKKKSRQPRLMRRLRTTIS